MSPLTHRANGRPVTLIDLLRQRAAEHPEALAFRFLLNGETATAALTWREVDTRARAVGAFLQQRARRGGRVFVVDDAGPSFMTGFFGCLYAGLIPVPVAPPKPRHADRLAAIAERCHPTVVLSVSDGRARLSRGAATAGPLGSAEWLDIRDVPDDLSSAWRDPNLSGDDLAFLQFTSGSTARPRGVMVSHANVLHNQQMMQRAFSTGPRSIVVGWLPLHHDMGLIGTVLHPLYLGVSGVLMSPGHFMERPMRWLRAVSRYRATISGGPNFAFDLCARRAQAEELESLDLSCWEVAFNGSEPVRPETLRRFARTFAASGFKPQAFHPCYGLAEATLFVAGRPRGGPASRNYVRSSLETSAALRADDDRTSPEGPSSDAVSIVELAGYEVPALEQRLVIVEPNRASVCGPREIGELCVSGPAVARGYWNDPDETRLAFDDRIEGEPGTFLRTGDLGFVDEGTLFITGRLKDVVTIRGRTIHPEDVERTVAASHAALGDAARVAFAVDDGGEERLVVVQELPRGYRHVSREGIAAAARQAVADEYEVQLHTFVLVATGRIPRTTSGKLQRRLCRARFLAGSLQTLAVDLLRPADGSIAEADPSARAAESGGTPIVSILQEEAARLVGIHAAAIDLSLPPGAFGIDSLMSVELQYCLERRFGVDLPDGAVRRAATLSALGEALAARLAADRRPVAAAIDGRAAAFPLSSGQRALWFLEQLEGAGTSAILTRAVHIDGPLDVTAFERALHALADRHEALRTTFGTSAAEPVQVVHPRGGSELEVLDASDWTGDALQLRVQDFADRPMTLSTGPLVRALLVRRSDVQHVFAMTLHHSIADYWSLGVMLRDLEELYAAEREDRCSRLPPLDASYRDYVTMERTLLQSAEAERLQAFWEQRLDGAPFTLDLAFDRPRPPVRSSRGASNALAIGSQLTASLHTFAAARKTTIFTVMLAAYQTLLHRYSGQADLLVGTPVASRPARCRDTIGYFVNLVPMRAVFADDTTFERLVEQAGTWVREALDHQTLPFAAMVERLRPPRDPSRHPLVQCTFALLTDRHVGRPGVAACAAGVDGPPLPFADLALTHFPIEHRAAQFDLSLALADSPQGLVGRFEYNTDLFDVATIGSLSTRWIALLDTLVSNPAARLGDLPLVTADEQRALAEGAAVIRRPLAVRTIHERFEAQVDRAANACVADETNAIGYQELNARANQWARYLKRRGLRADTRAALCITRSIDMVVGALAILKAGGAYVPLDPSHPTGRLAGVLADCDARILVADRSALARLPPFTGRIVCLDDDETDIREEETSNLHEAVQPEQAAYVLYTSGSTGSPNGVVVAHESVCNLLESMQRTPGLRPHDRLLSVTTLAFDIAGLELFLPLITGASLMIAGEETVRDGQRLMDRLMGFDATVMQATPSTWRMLLDAGWPGKADLAVLCGGEALTRDLAAQLLPRCGALWNMYGPTETTIWSTTTRISGVDDRRISLGFPIDNTEVYVLDGRLQPTPPGVPGEIFIGGIGLARGYLGRPDLTAARFVPHPFSQLPGARLYRTGDRGRQRSDGSLEFLGRLDDQVKVRGFRVELRELERALAEHPAVRHAVAALGQDPRGESALVAYVVLDRTGSGPAAGMERELREHLAAMLPVYMVPAAVVLLHELPLTPNGKVDRRRLPPVVWGSAAALASQPGSAREQIIRDIWRDVLKIDRVGMTDNFFDLGGHSLLLNDVRTRIVSAFARDVPTIEFFQRPTIRALARYLDDHGLAPDFAEAHALHAADRRRAAGSRQRELKRRRMHGATLRDE